MTTRSELIRYLRDHIVGGMHVGQLRAGDRLPSIRELAEQFGRNTRTVKLAYSALESEGLVEVRARSGVFVATHQILKGKTSEGRTSDEVARWMIAVVVEAWKRRVAVPKLPQFVSRLTNSRPVRCGLVEILEDGLVALEHELETEWGFNVRAVAPNAVAKTRDVDFFAATNFYAPSIHDVVDRLGKPLVALTIHPGLQQAIRDQIRHGMLTVVAVDRRFADRIRIVYSTDHPERVRFVQAGDREALASLDPSEPVLLTRAASRILGRIGLPMIFPHSPTLSAETAEALASILVRKNVESLR